MSDANKAQIDFCDGRVGEKWAAMQVRLYATLSQATLELLAWRDWSRGGACSILAAARGRHVWSCWTRGRM